MTSSEFFNKFKSKYLWGNLFAMAIVVVLLCVGVKFGIDIYTHHGEAIPIPDIRHKNFADAERILADAGLQIEVSDTGFVRNLPPDCILEQSPTPGDVSRLGASSMSPLIRGIRLHSLSRMSSTIVRYERRWLS